MGPGQRPASKRPWTWPPEVARVHHLALLCGLFRGGSSTDWDPCGLLPRPCGLASPCLLGASGGRWQVRTNHRAASAEDGGCSRFRLRFRHKGSRNPYWGHSREKVAPGKAALTGLYENGQPRPRYAQACVFPPPWQLIAIQKHPVDHSIGEGQAKCPGHGWDGLDSFHGLGFHYQTDPLGVPIILRESSKDSQPSKMQAG